MRKSSTKFAQPIFVLLLCALLGACVTERQIIGDVTKVSDANQRADNSARRAVSYMELKQYETAETILKKALKDAPKHSTANYTYAILKLRLGETKKAERFFRAAVKNNPDNSRAAHDYGFYLCSQGRSQAGVKMFEQAIANPLFKERGLSYLRAGECIFKSNKETAEKYFVSAYRDNPNLSVALFRLAELNYLRQDALKARAYYQRYAAAQPDTSASLFLAYQIERLAGAEQEALLHRKNLIKKFPGSSEAKQVRKNYKK